MHDPKCSAKGEMDKPMGEMGAMGKDLHKGMMGDPMCEDKDRMNKAQGTKGAMDK